MCFPAFYVLVVPLLEIFTEVWLTLGDDQRWVEEEVSHQLGRQLVEEAAGDGPVEEHVLVLHHVHQRHRRRALILGHTLDLHTHATPSEYFIGITSMSRYNITL